jgi:hypothetical protein
MATKLAVEYTAPGLPERSRGASESLGKLRVIRTLEMIREAAVQRWPTGSWTSGITLFFGLSFLNGVLRLVLAQATCCRSDRVVAREA